jgi:hypothetical protein
MRKLSPPKAISHALNSVWVYRAMAIRIILPWLPVIIAVSVLEYFAGTTEQPATGIGPGGLMQIASTVVAIAAVAAISVNWHRFILRDETPQGMRLDGLMMRYAGNTILTMLPMLLPALLMVFGIVFFPPLVTFVGLPLLLIVGATVTRLSIKLPAVALDDRGFTFRDAWAATQGSFWPCLGVFLLNALILLGFFLALSAVSSLLNLISPAFAMVFLVVAAGLMQLVYSLLNASILTSLYGYFVERRDF